MMLAEEALERSAIAVADLAEHPADGLVDQILAIGKQPLRDRERVGELALPDVRERRDDRNAPLP